MKYRGPSHARKTWGPAEVLNLLPFHGDSLGDIPTVLPTAHMMNVSVRVTIFLVCPAMFLDSNDRLRAVVAQKEKVM
jgi:hypothetical protein